MIGLYRLPSTKRWLTECPERYGIQLRKHFVAVGSADDVFGIAAEELRAQ
jgi:hypothetical protein